MQKGIPCFAHVSPCGVTMARSSQKCVTSQIVVWETPMVASCGSATVACARLSTAIERDATSIRVASEYVVKM